MLDLSVTLPLKFRSILSSLLLLLLILTGGQPTKGNESKSSANPTFSSPSLIPVADDTTLIPSVRPAYDENTSTTNIRPKVPPEGTLGRVGNDGIPTLLFPLGHCLGDCDSHDDCADDLLCYFRAVNDPPPPGCTGFLSGGTDYCYNVSSIRNNNNSSSSGTVPTVAPTTTQSLPTPCPRHNFQPCLSPKRISTQQPSVRQSIGTNDPIPQSPTSNSNSSTQIPMPPVTQGNQTTLSCNAFTVTNNNNNNNTNNDVLTAHNVQVVPCRSDEDYCVTYSISIPGSIEGGIFGRCSNMDCLDILRNMSNVQYCRVCFSDRCNPVVSGTAKHNHWFTTVRTKTSMGAQLDPWLYLKIIMYSVLVSYVCSGMA